MNFFKVKLSIIFITIMMAITSLPINLVFAQEFNNDDALTKTIDDIVISIEKESDDYLNDAHLLVNNLSEEEKDEVNKLIYSLNDTNKNIVYSYAYDISLLDEDDNDYQLDQSVNLSFLLPAIDENLNVALYHIHEDEVNLLDIEIEENVIKTNIDSFSYFVVELSYEDLNYTFDQDSITLQQLLLAVGLKGEASEVVFSDDDIFTLIETLGEETIFINQDFENEEWIKVIINNIEYQINVKKNNNYSSSLSFKATSETNNIVGDVFANSVNNDIRPNNLDEYPLDKHELDYYGDSKRVRYLPDNYYLVYRDSLLLIEDSDNYVVNIAEDGLSAIVSPIIDISELTDKTGIVFLRENVGYDDVLVFNGMPTYDEDKMYISLLPKEDITINQLFSDGALGAPALRRGFIVKWEENPKGTNWSAKLSNTNVNIPEPYFEIDVFDLLLEFGLEFKFSYDIEITSTGATGKKEAVTVAGVEVPVKTVFVLGAEYQLEVEFDENPITVEARITTDFDLAVGTHGSRIANYVTKVDVKDVDTNVTNTDISFYIGTKIVLEGAFLKLDVDLWVVSVTIGPVLELDIDSAYGTYFIANWEKDKTFKDDDPYIHTCAKQGLDGCLSLAAKDVSEGYFRIIIDLYFYQWPIDIPYARKTVKEYHLYNSYTYNNKFFNGYCPHLFYLVPVYVYSDSFYSTPIPNMNVRTMESLNVYPEEEDLIKGVTNSRGEVLLYLPYYDNYKYNILAEGEFADIYLTGNKRQEDNIIRGENPRVNIFVSSDEKVNASIRINWDVDMDLTDVPLEEYIVLQYRSEGYNWYYTKHDSQAKVSKVNNEWVFTYEDLPKYDFSSGSAKYIEYRVRLIEEFNGDGYAAVIDEKDGDYKYAYRNVGSKQNKYYPIYEDSYDDMTYVTLVDEKAVVDINLNKKWDINYYDIPSAVYLALSEKPIDEYIDRAYEAKVPTDWTTILNPIEGNSKTLNDLVNEDVLTVSDIGNVGNVPLAIDKVNKSNNWSTSFSVPKYRNGIPMQYQAVELETSTVENLLKNEYNITPNVEVVSFGEYKSIPGPVKRDKNDYTFSATVINTNKSDDYIHGLVHWQDNKDMVMITLHIYKNGEIDDNLSVTINPADYNYDTLNHWSHLVDDLDAEYEVAYVEFIDLDPIWFAEIDGLDVYLTKYIDNKVYIRAKAVFDDVFDKSLINSLNVNVKSVDGLLDDQKYNETITLNRNNNYVGVANKTVSKNNLHGAADYELIAPDLSQYNLVKIIEKPTQRIEDGKAYYDYVVNYKLQSNLELHITKKWLNTDDSTVYPDNVHYDVYRNNELISSQNVGKDDGEIVISRDLNNNPLRRLDENNKPYEYTIIEDTYEGFTSKVVKTNETTDKYYFDLNNTWVGSDYVNFAGKIIWDDEDNIYESRPDSLQVTLLNSDNQYVRTIEVFKDNDYSYEFKYLPNKNKDDNDLSYYVLPNYVKYYDYEAGELTFDEATRTWKQDVTEELTAYFEIKIYKQLIGKYPPGEDSEEYQISVEPIIILGDDDPEESMLINDDIKVRAGEYTQAQFLFEEEGLYVYCFKEIAGDTVGCIYDPTEYHVVILKSRDGDGKVKYTSWIGEGDDDGHDIPSTLSEYNLDDIYDDANEPVITDRLTFVNTIKSVVVEKQWMVDKEGRDHTYYAKAVVQEKENGQWKTVEELTLLEAQDWQEVCDDLPVYRKDPNTGALVKIEYRVREWDQENNIIYDENDEDRPADSIPNQYEYSFDGRTIKYQVAYEYDDDVTFTIVNTALVDIDVNKVWNDNNNANGDRPDAITVRLYADGKQLDIKEIKESDEWKYTFTDLIKYKDGEEIIYTLTEDNISKYTNVISGNVEDGFTITNTHEPGKTQVNVIVSFTDSENQDGIRPISVDVELLADGDETGDKLTLDQSNNWTATFENLVDMKDGSYIKYTVKEVEEGVIGNEDIEGKYRNDISGDAKQGFIIENIHTPVRFGAFGVVEWDDDNDMGNTRPDAIVLRLWADGEEIANRKLASGDSPNWSYAFESLPKYNNGKLIIYNITVDKIDHYTTEVNDDDLNNIKIKNTYIPELVDIDVSLVWDDDNNRDGIRPDSVIITLYRNDEIGGETIEANADNDWSGTFSGLFKTNNQYEAINYTVGEENAVITGEDGAGTYRFTLSGNMEEGFILTNIHTPETVDIEGAKTWNDNDDEDGMRPSTITIRLFADDVQIDSSTIRENSEGGWQWSFVGKPKYNQGQEITYTIKEDDIDEYGKVIVGYDVTNNYNPTLIEFNVSKVWDDNDNQDGIRPKSVIIKLLENGKETDKTIELNDDNEWQNSFTDLVKKKNGKVVSYTIEEIIDDTYTCKVEGNMGDGFVVTNTHMPETRTINISLNWDDADNKDGIRPNVVDVKLFANGVDTGNVLTISKDDDWKASFKDIDVYKDGEVIGYTIDEVKTAIITGVDSEYTYSYSISGDLDNGFVITNKHTPSEEPIKEVYAITYKLNGGSYNGRSDDIIENYVDGTTLKIHAAPTRDGYTFLYWQGSIYLPGDEYTVTENHIFTAIWQKKNDPTPKPEPTPRPDPVTPTYVVPKTGVE